MDKMTSESDGDVLIPTGYKYCEVMPLPDYDISKTIVLYQTDDITIRQLISQYERKENLTQKLKKKKERVCFLLGKRKLSVDNDDSLKKIKDKLHNYKISNFVFYPYIEQYGAMILQCATNYKDHEDYFDQLNQNNTITAYLYFPQIHQRGIQSNLQCNKTVVSELVAVLKKSDFAKNDKLWQYQMKIQCLTCKVDREINPNRFVSETISSGHKVQVLFPKIKPVKYKDQRQTIHIRINKGKDNTINQFTYAEIGDLPVKSILILCSVQQPNSTGLRILGNYLKSFQFISSIHDRITSQSNPIDAYLVYESQFFYRALPNSIEKNIILDNSETKQKIEESRKQKMEKQKVQLIKYQIMKQLRNQRISQLDENVNKSLKKIEFFDPIWCYTSHFIYDKLNMFLYGLNFLELEKNDIKESWDIQFTFCLINSLLNLPNYQGTVYRGTSQIFDFKVGSIQSFKAFLSTSKQIQVANRFSRNTLLTIKCLSGKCIEQFSYYPDEKEVLLFPFTYFKVTSMVQINGKKHYELQELPAPRRFDQNMIVWVDDNPENNIEMFNRYKRDRPEMKSELIQLLSNDHLKLWLEYYGHHLVNPDIKVKAISNMRRNQDLQAGIETIKTLRKFDPNLEIVLFVGHSPKALQILKNHKIVLSDKLKLDNREHWLSKYIQDEIVKTEKEELSSCQVM